MSRRLKGKPAGIALVVFWGAASLALAGCGRTPQASGDGLGELGGGEQACAASEQCGEGQYCTVADGECRRPPGCGPQDPCPAVCYGVCRAKPSENGTVTCGSNTCPVGQVCCNASCGICTPPDGACTQQACEPAPPAGRCSQDSDCRAFSDYCTGCDCRALGPGDPDPLCPHQGVQCLRDPCQGQRAVCQAGQCALAPKAPAR